ncbi:hypothetical protein [Variovorax paradoxus]|uniref:hypothetical protein n=1 Tax=Variovorax paradoxus TaxID=34073 RepID=UPI003D658612
MSWFDTYLKPVLDTLTAIGTLVALGALVVTVIKNRRDEDARKQQELLEQCKRTLEWAYNALMPDPTREVAEANRLNWLTAARHILAYQDLKKLITVQPQARIVEDFEEFWRHRFYLALSDVALSTYHYWAKPDPILVNLHPTSALIVVDFSGWPETKVDPVDLTDEQIASLKTRNGFSGSAGSGLKAYIEKIEMRHGKGTPSPKKPG